MLLSHKKAHQSNELYSSFNQVIISYFLQKYTIVKKGTIYLAKEAAQVNDWVSLAMDVGGVIWEATETADTRCWGLLPAKIQVWSVELPVGEHHVSFTPEERSGVSGGVTLSSTITINANRNTYALVTYPSGEPVGGVVVSKR